MSELDDAVLEWQDAMEREFDFGYDEMVEAHRFMNKLIKTKAVRQSILDSSLEQVPYTYARLRRDGTIKDSYGTWGNAEELDVSDDPSMVPVYVLKGETK